MRKGSTIRVLRFGCRKPDIAAARAASASLGFTLLELLVAMAILGLMVAMLFAAFGQASRGWLQAENRVETFTQARAALDYMSKELSQAMASTNVPFLATTNSLAFVAPVSTDPADGADIEEVVYRLSSNDAFTSPDPSGFFVDLNPPFKLIRRVSPYIFTTCQNYYLNGSPCSPLDPWDFYGSVNWPETSDSTRTAIVAENILSLEFTLFSTNGVPYPYWNSTENRGSPPGAVNSYPPWQNELPPGIGYNNMDVNGGPGSGCALHMTNRAPAAVQIVIGAVDSRAAARLKAVPFGSAAWKSIAKQATQYFTTYVSIPNRQP